MKLRFAVAIAVAVVVAGTLGFAQEQRQVIQERYPESETIWLTYCDAYSLLYEYDADVHELRSTDKDGNVTRIRNIHTNEAMFYLYDGNHPSDRSIFLMAAPGVTQTERVTNLGAANEVYTITGDPARVNIPGYGLFFAQTGKTVFDLTGETHRGHNDFFGGNYGPICGYLLSLL